MALARNTQTRLAACCQWSALSIVRSCAGVVLCLLLAQHASAQPQDTQWPPSPPRPGNSSSSVSSSSPPPKHHPPPHRQSPPPKSKPPPKSFPPPKAKPPPKSPPTRPPPKSPKPPPSPKPPAPPTPSPRPPPKPPLKQSGGSSEDGTSVDAPLPPGWTEDMIPDAPDFPVEPEAPPPFPPAPPGGRSDELDRAIGAFEQLDGPGMVVAVHMVAVPGTDVFLFMERPSGYHPDKKIGIAGYYNPNTQKFTYVRAYDGLFCCGHSFTDDGNLLIVGGHRKNSMWKDGMNAIRMFDRSLTQTALTPITKMFYKRWYPSVTLLPDGQVLIMGGTQGVGAGTANNKWWELYDPMTESTTRYKMDNNYLAWSKQVYYPFNYVLPFTGDLFTFCGRRGFILDWRTNTWKNRISKLGGYATTQFPYTGSSVMLGLYPEKNYQPEFMLFGGTNEEANRNLKMKATRASQRLRVTINPETGTYNISGWTSENMAYGRVMPDSVILPNGQVVVLSGASEGLAGDSAGGGDSRAKIPQFYAELYNPDKPRGKRFRTLARSRIPRMYHSTACLTINGTIIVAGCDRCHRFGLPSGTSYSPPRNKAEYRVEIMYPPFWFYTERKPTIESIGSDQMPYRAPFTINYSFPADGPAGNRITQAVLVAPCSCTHSFNMHQRLVGLEILNDDTTNNVLTVAGPPDIYIAPPGMYMLFLLNGEYYSTSKWVTLPRP